MEDSENAEAENAKSGKKPKARQKNAYACVDWAQIQISRR